MVFFPLVSGRRIAGLEHLLVRAYFPLCFLMCCRLAVRAAVEALAYWLAGSLTCFPHVLHSVARPVAFSAGAANPLPSPMRLQRLRPPIADGALVRFVCGAARRAGLSAVDGPAVQPAGTVAYPHTPTDTPARTQTYRGTPTAPAHAQRDARKRCRRMAGRSTTVVPGRPRAPARIGICLFTLSVASA